MQEFLIDEVIDVDHSLPLELLHGLRHLGVEVRREMPGLQLPLQHFAGAAGFLVPAVDVTQGAGGIVQIPGNPAGVPRELLRLGNSWF
ncbi:MAG TPA: hypothetical protein VGO11_07285 [Chthoniobacteraceae bacterium]|nr:hypothetical protein [Chthoniobacteraceae bacterium]